MALMAIDPGTEQSAYILLGEDRRTVVDMNIIANGDLLDLLQYELPNRGPPTDFCCEMIASYGLPVGKETFETVLWIGRFVQAVAPRPMELITRHEVKMALCHTVKGVNDSVLRQRIIDLYGPGKGKAVGNKKSPGPLYGIKSDMWSALAVALAVTCTTQVEGGGK